jgi:hypothetical protein
VQQLELLHNKLLMKEVLLMLMLRLHVVQLLLSLLLLVLLVMLSLLLLHEAPTSRHQRQEFALHERLFRSM